MSNNHITGKKYAVRGKDTQRRRYRTDTAWAGPAEECQLVPYGCAKLRMTELPRLRMK